MVWILQWIIFLFAFSADLISNNKNFLVFIFLLAFWTCVFQSCFLINVSLNVNNGDLCQLQLFFVLNILELSFQFIWVIHVNIYALLPLFLTLPNEIWISIYDGIFGVLPIYILKVDIMLLNQVDCAGNHHWALLNTILIEIVSKNAILVIGHDVVHRLLGLECAVLSLRILIVILNILKMDSGCLRNMLMRFYRNWFFFLLWANCLIHFIFVIQ